MSLQTRITDFLVHKHTQHTQTQTFLVNIDFHCNDNNNQNAIELVCLYVHIVFQLHYAVKLIIRTVMQLKLVTDYNLKTIIVTL